MGTFSTAPMGNDTALDFKDALADRATPRERGLMLRTQFAMLCTFQPGTQPLNNTLSDVHLAYQATVGACAIVVDKLLGEYLWLSRLDDDDEDLRLEDLPDIDAPTLELACSAIRLARILSVHPEMPGWRTAADAALHAECLEEMEGVLRRHAAQTPGCSAFLHDK